MTSATNTSPGAAAYTSLDSILSPAQETESPSSIGADHSRLIRDKTGQFMFIGDSANLSFLHTLRAIIGDSQGSSAFVDDPLRSYMVEVIPEDNAKAFDSIADANPPNVPLAKAKHLAHQFFIVTDGVLDVFDESDLLASLPAALVAIKPNVVARTLAYLVMAIGAKCDADDQAELGESLFRCARLLTAQYLMDNASVETAQVHVLIAMYLLCASRRNAAYIYLGHATRLAYSLGVHMLSVSDKFSTEERLSRERLWTSIRSLDLFTSASLGRPTSTFESRSLDLNEPNAIQNGLYAIMETILTDVYGQRRINTEMLGRIGFLQRQWADSFASALDSRKPTVQNADTQSYGLIHIKQAYYWTIMLLTRPFLVDRVSAYAQATKQSPDAPIQPCVISDPSKTLVHACVDSAVKTINILAPLAYQERLPRHLPLVINAAFHSALVLGLAHFGDLFRVFPLEASLNTAHKILCKFNRDSVGIRNAAIIGFLKGSCDTYFEKRQQASMAIESEAISHLFGQINDSCSKNSIPQCNKLDNFEASSNDRQTRSSGRQMQIQDTFRSSAFANGQVPAHEDALMRIFGDTELDLFFPDTPQATWLLDSEYDITSLYAAADMTDPGLFSNTF